MSLEGADKEEFEVLMRKHGITWDAFKERVGRPAYTIRTYLTCLYYLEGEKRASARCPIRFQRDSLVSEHIPKTPSIHIPNSRLHLVLGGNASAQACFAVCGGKHALVSYEHIRSFAHYQHLREFVNDPMGTCKTLPALRQYYDVLKGITNVE